MSRVAVVPLKWKFDQGLHFAHAPEGHWTIEQLRGRFLVTLKIKGTISSAPEQDMGSYKSLAMAKKVATHASRKIRTLL